MNTGKQYFLCRAAQSSRLQLKSGLLCENRGTATTVNLSLTRLQFFFYPWDTEQLHTFCITKGLLNIFLKSVFFAYSRLRKYANNNKQIKIIYTLTYHQPPNGPEHRAHLQVVTRK